jgi:hypothetical protein
VNKLNLASESHAYPNRNPDLMYEVARDHLTGQLAAADAADAKLGMLVGWGSAAPGIFAAVLALRPTAFHAVETLLLVGTGVAYLILAVIVYLALSRKKWGLGPNLRQVWRDHLGKDERRLKWDVAADYLGYYEANKPKYDGKVTALRWSLALVFVESSALVLGLVLVASGN